ncbi:MAG: ATP-binding protein [Oscillospiraceae bacterium]|nr:ATP-binding protein [Eubacteriales bacterium]MDY2617736.1 ATP-binding protein [Oscillospiraceae bacterium]
MRKKIFQNYLLVEVLVLVLCCGLFLGVLFQHYEKQAFSQLRTEANYIAHGMELSGESYLNTLRSDARVTWVDADGTVRYDSVADPAAMQNHLNRKEIAEALRNGEGDGSHFSETLMERTLYYAVRLGDGTVLRVSCTQKTVMAMLLMMMPPLLGVAAAVLLICMLMAFRLARHIVDPINRIDLDHPVVEETYGELEPLVKRIQEQNRTIRRQMDELSQRQREFSALTDNMSEGFLLVDYKTNVLSANHSALRMLGDGKAEEITNLRRDNCLPQVLTTVEAALAGVRTETVQEIGGISWQVIANPVVSSGQVAGVAVLLMDVTEREQREKLRQEFSANVSHELKTPLTSITGFAELMKEGMVTGEKVKEFAGDIYREARRLIDLVNDIIRLSRLDENSKLFESEQVDLYDLCDEIIANLQNVAERQNVMFSLSGEHVTISGVWQILNEMVYNLCDNAIKYNRPGGTVDVSVRRDGGSVRLTVRDTGIGIPYADQPRVFERFYRVDKSHSKEVGGTGLGLSIVKHGAQYHNARLELESEPGKGTSISIVF